MGHWTFVIGHSPWTLAVYCLGIALLTHVPMPQVPSAPRHTDKLVHAGMYAGLAFLLAAWWSARRASFGWRDGLIVWCIATAYGAIDELTQIPLATRSADVYDWLTDIGGAGLGLVAFLVMRRMWRLRTDENDHNRSQKKPIPQLSEEP